MSRHPPTARGGLFVLYVFSLLLPFLCGCGGVNPSSSTGNDTGTEVSLDWGSITGRVTASGTPLAQAYIETTTRQAVTASAGTYLLGPLPAGDYRLIARAAGLQSQVRTGVRVRPGLVTEGVDFALTTGTATAAADFEVLAISPAFGTDGETMTVIGTGFGSTPGRVTVADQDARILDWNSKLDGRIVVQLPAEVETGPVKVIIAGQLSHETQALTFTARPVLVEALPPSAKPGATLTLRGRNFNLITAFNKVSLNGKACQVVTVSSARQMTIILPAGATTGILQIRLETNEFQLDGLSTAVVTILPELVHMAPKRSIPDVTITLYGRNFTTDKSAVKVLLGGRKTIQGNEILSLSDTRLTFKAPGTDVVPAGEAVEVRVSVNGFQTEKAIVWTAYNPAWTTLSAYGLYDFTTVSTGGTLHLPSLPATDRLALISVTSGDATLDLGDTYSYILTSVLGNNRAPIPSEVSSLAMGRASLPPGGGTASVYRDVGPLLRRLFPPPAGGQVRPALGAGAIRPAIADPAPASATFWLVDFVSGNPGDPTTDDLATATLAATGTYCLVYLDTATDTVVTASDAEKIAARFDGIYATLATACWDGVSVPAEGNIDAQPRILLLLTHQINRDSTSGLNVLGYFNPRDKVPTQTHSAGTEILYLWDQCYKNNFDDFSGIMAHELQHMMHYNQKGTAAVDWINEGLSVWAQQVAGYGFTQGMPTPVSYVSTYLGTPHTVSLNHWPDDAGLENYGMSYLFIEYLFERCGGYVAIRNLEKNQGESGLNDVQTNVLPLAVPPTGGALEPFFHDFGLAMFLDNLPIPETLPGHEPTRYVFPKIDLRTTFSGVRGLHHLTFDENPVLDQTFTMKGFGADVLEYLGGNGGDLEITRSITPSVAGYKCWVLYYSTK